MNKRPRDVVDDVSRAPKRPRKAIDRLSNLTDELILRVLSFLSVSELCVCHRISHKFSKIAADSQLWKALYYARYVRPRAARLPGIRNTGVSADSLLFSSKLSKWLDEDHLVRRGRDTNWKRQYKLRHNWSKGSCAVSEVEIAERSAVPPLLVCLQDSVVWTADSDNGLRTWRTKDNPRLAGSTALKTSPPTSLAIDNQEADSMLQHAAVGFEDGSFAVYELNKGAWALQKLYEHAPSSNGMVSAIAYAWPYLLTMTESQTLSLYYFGKSPSCNWSGPPRLLHSLRSHTAWPPSSLAIRTSTDSITASIAYALPTYHSGWSVGIQEVRLSLDGDLLDSRLAASENERYRPLTTSMLGISPSLTPTPTLPGANTSILLSSPIYAKPTSLSYTHPYLLLSHPDNTLTLYLVKSTDSTLSISPGNRLWGHTSSVSGAHVGRRGKAVSVSSRGDELRVWELEGGLGSSANRRRATSGDLSIQVRPEMKRDPNDLSVLSEAIERRGDGLGLVLQHRVEDMNVTRGLVGFDEENVFVLREKSHGGQALVVYDFT